MQPLRRATGGGRDGKGGVVSFLPALDCNHKYLTLLLICSFPLGTLSLALHKGTQGERLPVHARCTTCGQVS